MKTFTIQKTLAAWIVCATVFVSLNSTAHAQFSPVMQETPNWSFEFLGKVYDRPTDDLGLSLVSDSVTNATLLTSDQATDLNGGTGAEVKFNYRGRRSGVNWEVRSFIADFTEDNTVEGANLFSPLFPTITPDSIFTNYESSLFSLGIAAKRSVAPGVNLLFGPRFYSVRETYQAGFDQVVNTGFGPFTVIGSQTNRVRNSMYGLQGGVEFNMPINNNFRVQGYGRFGGYVNPAKLTITTTNNLPTSTPVTSTFDSTAGAFVGEVGGRLYLDILPNMFGGFVGYEATWIDGLAVAPSQFIGIGTPGSPAIDTTNTPFWHALTFGLQYTY